jgi:hypothetical protein
LCNGQSGGDPWYGKLSCCSKYCTCLFVLHYGVSLGQGEEEIKQAIAMIQDLEQARCNVFLSDKIKDEIKETHKGVKLDIALILRLYMVFL